MKRHHATGALLLTLTLAAVPAGAEHHEAAGDVNEIVARHIEAKGGRDAWNAIDSFKLTGEFTAFSKVHPFTVHKTRDRRYHIDHVWGDQSVVIGFDGETPWWDHRFFGKGARKIDGADRAVLERDLDFATPFFDLEASGHTATLLGKQDLEGQEVIAIELQRADESKETWYLDPSSYLEVARDSPGSDFGQPMTQRTFFDSFQEVAGVMIPHYTETQWYTRHRVIDAQAIEVNVDIDDELFLMPAPFGMEKLQNLAGSWTIAVESRQNPAAPFTEREGDSVIEAHFRGGLFEETWTNPNGTQVMRTLSYDQFRERYLVTLIDSSTNAMDILAGGWNEEGALVLDDLVTETPSLLFGLTIYERMRLYDLERDSFKIERESSIDGGETWAVMQKLAYTRKTDSADSAEGAP
ncbi:MAG: DUF1579 domain-containing protein [bacterium]|nr:DUF1579 domain-containing protein [bacterium]